MTDPAKALGLRPDIDDYRPPPPARWSQPYTGGVVMALTVIGALLTGFLISTGITTGRAAAQAQDARNAELVELITVRQDRVDALAEQLEDLRAQVVVAEEEITGPSSLRTAVRQAEQRAGVSRVAGPGLRVSLDDGPTPCPGEQPSDCRIQDTDLQLIVNALFGIGAEGVAVNGERVIATTAIRNAGGAILVNYRVLSPPYVVEAIGNPDVLGREFARTTVAQDFEVWKGVYGLAFSQQSEDELLLPGFTGSLRFLRAVAGEGGG